VHEALGVWVGAITSVTVALVAVGVVFLQDFVSQQRDRQDKAWRYLVFASGAIGALDLMMEWQKDLYERSRTPLGGQQINWRFELEYRTEVVRVALAQEILEPALVEHLARIQAWLKDALSVLPNDPTPALQHFQASTRGREAAATDLRRMMRPLHKSAVSFWPPKRPKWTNIDEPPPLEP
jgi:hypothetical protein